MAAVALLAIMPQVGASPGRRAARARPYDGASPFNRKIPASAAIDPRSARMVRGIEAAVRRQGAIVTWRAWSVPVYRAGPRAPRRRVRLTASWAPRRWLVDVPIPAGAEPDPENDGHMAVIDPKSGCEYDFWQAREQRGRWTASWANALPIAGSGVYAKGLSARGSGFALLGGLIRPGELRRGRIDHALVWSYFWPKQGGPVPPATESDGTSRRPDAIPEGARVRLDPRLDISTLRLRPYQRTIAHALQDYGAYLADGGSGFAVYAQNPLRRRADPYRGLLPHLTYPPLGIPIDRLQVLRLPPQVPHPPIAVVPSGCNRFR